MIVWLASYPRSGNTLLRTVMHQCFSLPSYTDEDDPAMWGRVGLTEQAEAMFGHRSREQPWDDFVREATASPVPVLVKTHRHPPDDQRAIYVVRDGRKAIVSYRHFHQSYLGERQLSLLQLVLGLDHYGGWSEHYQAWTRNRPGTLVVDFGALAEADDAMLQRLAGHAGCDGPQRKWDNPFAALQKENPSFFREGRAAWEGDPTWGPTIDAAFFCLHGELMRFLGYADQSVIEAARARLSAEVRELLAIVRDLDAKCKSLQMTCDERLGVIRTLKQACDERLALINRLTGREASQVMPEAGEAREGES